MQEHERRRHTGLIDARDSDGINSVKYIIMKIRTLLLTRNTYILFILMGNLTHSYQIG